MKKSHLDSFFRGKKQIPQNPHVSVVKVPSNSLTSNILVDFTFYPIKSHDFTMFTYGCFQKMGWAPKMDGENNGKPLLIHGWFGGVPLFLETSIYYGDYMRLHSLVVLWEFEKASNQQNHDLLSCESSWQGPWHLVSQAAKGLQTRAPEMSGTPGNNHAQLRRLNIYILTKMTQVVLEGFCSGCASIIQSMQHSFFVCRPSGIFWEHVSLYDSSTCVFF